jgi:hypothetical protein
MALATQPCRLRRPFYLSVIFELGESPEAAMMLKFLLSLALPRGLEPLFSP